jgi:deoxyribonuclease V
MLQPLKEQSDCAGPVGVWGTLEAHPWPKTIDEALALERDLATRMVIRPGRLAPETVASVDTAYGSGAEQVYASAVLLSHPDLREISRRSVRKEVVFPYVPGLFYFREGPAILEALSNLPSRPDVVVVHGHGTAHPRRCGMASLIGVSLNVPTIGCSRRLLAGRHRPVPPKRGSQKPILVDGRTVGCALRTRDGVKPLFVSPGHLCDLTDALELMRITVRGYRMPEPLRLAHLLVNKYKRQIEDRQHQSSHPGR